MQNGLKRMRTSDPPSVTNSNQISDTIQQDFPLTSNTNANSGGGGGGNGRSSIGGTSGNGNNGNRQIREPTASQQQQLQKHDSMKSQESQHPLFTRGICTWAGCETTCDTYPAFISHLKCPLYFCLACLNVKLQLEITLKTQYINYLLSVIFRVVDNIYSYILII